MGDAYRRDIREYYAAITGDDEQISRILTTLNKQGLSDNTIVLFIADHGDCLGKHDEITKNNLYEESLRVPFILYWKGHIQPGIDNKCLMSYPDIYPTLIDMMGLKSKIPSSVQGTSRASYLLKKDNKYPTLQYFMGNIHVPDSTSGFRGVRTQQYKLVYQREKGRTIGKYLYDIKSDRFEMHNLYGEMPGVTDSLKTQLIAWLQKTKDPFLKYLL
jgi:arylsulfatase A-like enzyme